MVDADVIEQAPAFLGAVSPGSLPERGLGARAPKRMGNSHFPDLPLPQQSLGALYQAVVAQMKAHRTHQPGPTCDGFKLLGVRFFERERLLHQNMLASEQRHAGEFEMRGGRRENGYGFDLRVSQQFLSGGRKARVRKTSRELMRILGKCIVQACDANAAEFP